MIVDFFRRGTGMSTSAVDYLLGKDRNREYASLLQGNVQEVSDLIDTSPYQKKYTAGVLSFYEHDFSDEAKKEIMQNFEKRCSLVLNLMHIESFGFNIKTS